MADDSTNKPSARRTERIGKYEIVGHLATGGMGVIYKARDADLDRLVALKILPPDLAKQQTTLIRFYREARAAARLRHENIVTLYDVGETNGTHYIALEFIEGTDLQDYINRKCRLDPEEATQIIIQAARALAAAHEQGIVHRDIKPSNLLLMRKAERLIVKLTDFGLAIRSENDAEFRITKDKTTVGTVDYMSPEQARDSRSADIRSDIYSLGCTFYHMLAGLAPFATGTLPERLIKHMKTVPPDVRKLNKLVPRHLVAIINRMLAKKPDDRYQTPAELLHDLENPESVAIPGKNGATGEALERRSRRNRVIDPTQVIENKELDEENETPRLLKNVRSRKKVIEQDETLPDEDAFDGKGESSQQVNDPRARKKGFEQDEDLPEDRDLDEEYDSPRQVKDSRARKNEIEQDEDWPEDEDYDPASEEPDEPWAPDPSEAATEDDEETPKKKAGAFSPVWIAALAGLGGVLVLVLIVAFMIGGGGKGPETKKDPERQPAPHVPIGNKDPEPKIEQPGPIVTIDTSPAKMTVALPALPIIPADSTAKSDPEALRPEYSGPYTAFPEPAKDAKVLRMSRLSADGPDTTRSLAVAFEKAPSGHWTVIEIHDSGPIYVPSLTALPQPNIVLRGAGGHRPLLIWEAPKKSAGAFCQMTQGKLILENLDVAVVWSDKGPAALFDLAGADFYARDCTFSVAGEAAKGQGVALVRRQNAAAEKLPAQTWLQRCYVRGADLSLVRFQESSSSMLIEDSLVVGYQYPLFDVRGRDQDTFDLYCVRSSLVTGDVLMRCRSENKAVTPKVNVHLLDSILGRDDGTSPLGNLLHLAEGADPAKLTWRATNSVYAGWKHLLWVSEAKKIIGTDQENWRKQWRYIDAEFDAATNECWPDDPPSGLAERSPDLFRPRYLPQAMKHSAVSYAALTGDGAIGCVIGRLPPAPEEWILRTLKPGAFPYIAGGDLTPPKIENVGIFYSGERIDLTKVADVGKYLTDKLQKVTPAQRVVIHLAGKGTVQTSPLRVKGVQNLVIYSEPNFKDPITLEESSAANLARGPLFDMSGGHLELIGARIRLGSALVPTIVQVQDGSLSLTRCWLLGPHAKTVGNFQSLITVTNSGPDPATLLLRESVFVGPKLLFKLQDHVQLHARNNVFLGLGDAVQFDALQPNLPLKHVLDHNTWAVRHSFFTLKTGPEFQPVEPVTMYAGSNAFLQPFAEDGDKGALLRGAESSVASGHWTWRGRYNVYDARMPAYFAGIERLPGGKQTRLDWQSVWGQTGEHEPLLLPAATAKTINPEAATLAALLLQLDRLALPPELRGDVEQARPGADLVLLGIKKK
jgi:serine/threonine-protein kinase